jgi:hypothetical protein
MADVGISCQPGAVWALRQLVTAFVHAGRMDEARRASLRLQESHAGLSVGKVKDALPFKENAMARIVAGLREAGTLIS